MRKLVAGWMALGVALGAPISVHAEDGTTRVTHHRTVHTVRMVHTVQVEHTATVEPVTYTILQGRQGLKQEVFSRNAEDCNRELCIGQ